MKDPGKWSGSINYRNIIGTKEGRINHGRNIHGRNNFQISGRKVSGEDGYGGRLLRIYLGDISGVWGIMREKSIKKYLNFYYYCSDTQICDSSYKHIFLKYSFIQDISHTPINPN